MSLRNDPFLLLLTAAHRPSAGTPESLEPAKK